MLKEHILIPAIYYDDGVHHIDQPININRGYVVLGYRHRHCESIKTLLNPTYDKDKTVDENKGFLTSHNRFVNRKEAFIIAKERGQIIHNATDMSNPILVSEDLYYSSEE